MRREQRNIKHYPLYIFSYTLNNNKKIQAQTLNGKVLNHVLKCAFFYFGVVVGCTCVALPSVVVHIESYICVYLV